jgi:serine/threonine-protein phosphatase 6 regulatory ankyrin repeat subunit B
VNKLILADADIYTSGEQYRGCTPLMLASKNGSKEITAKLLSVGADLEAQDDDGWTAIYYAIYYGNTEIFNQLLNNGALVEDVSLLIASSENGNREIIAKLIDCDVDVDIQDKNNYTPLICACENGNEHVVKQLIHARASVDIKNNNGSTSLMLASQNGHGEVVAQLLAAKADVDARDNDGVTALMLAIQNGDAEVVKLLIAAEANINIQTKAENYCIGTPFIEWGVNITTYSALTIACLYGFSDIVNLLVLAKNIDLDSRDSNGDTPLIFAIKCRNHEVISGGNDDVIRILLCAGADIEAKDALGCTPLILASQNNYYDKVTMICRVVEPHVVSQLLNAKANVSAQNINGRNALMYACENNCSENVFELLKYPDVADIIDLAGMTALMLASQNGHSAVVAQLLAIGANAEMADNTGMTALAIASQNGHNEIVELLNQYMRK